MISAAIIGEIIRNPDLAGNYPTPELSEIRDKFPYCSTLHLIYLKGLSLGNDLQFEEHLRYAAVHVVDRERMYYLIHSNPENQQQQEPGARLYDRQATVVTEPAKTEESAEKPVIELKIVTEESVEPIADLKIATQKTNLSASDGQETKPVIELKTTPDKVDEQGTELKATPEKEEPVIIEGIKAVEETKTENLPDTLENQPEENKQTGIKNILDAAPDLMELAYTEDLKAEEVIHQEKILDSADQSLVSERSALSGDSGEKIPETEPDLSNLSFIEWLQYKQSKKLPAQKETTTSKSIVEPAKKQQNQENTTEEQPKKAKKAGLSRSDVDALLNKFITEEPSISRPTAAFFSPVKTARQSLEEVPDLVTETLAKIYVLQKNYAKAIQAYEQLSLVYPEKKTFFATRIQKIKEDQQKQ